MGCWEREYWGLFSKSGNCEEMRTLASALMYIDICFHLVLCSGFLLLLFGYLTQNGISF